MYACMYVYTYVRTYCMLWTKVSHIHMYVHIYSNIAAVLFMFKIEDCRKLLYVHSSYFTTMHRHIRMYICNTYMCKYTYSTALR